jgi:hypothetical protein
MQQTKLEGPPLENMNEYQAVAPGPSSPPIAKGRIARVEHSIPNDAFNILNARIFPCNYA